MNSTQTTAALVKGIFTVVVIFIWIGVGGLFTPILVPRSSLWLGVSCLSLFLGIILIGVLAFISNGGKNKSAGMYALTLVTVSLLGLAAGLALAVP